MTEFSDYVYAMGRGPSKGRNLTREEAADAMAQILAGDVAPEAVGALLMLMRYRGETADEIAGFIDAFRERLLPWGALDVGLDWSSYAAGRSRGRPWFLLSAKLIAQMGVPVFLHGWNSRAHQRPDASVVANLEEAGIPVATTVEDARAVLAAQNIVYVPLEAMDVEMLRILRLRDVLGLRSPVNTALKCMNPTLAPVSVQGVFHPAYRELQRDAAQILGQRHLGVIKGGGGEFERHPGKDIAFFGLSDAKEIAMELPEVAEFAHQRLADGPGVTLSQLWDGASDDFAEGIVTGTAAIALMAMGRAEDEAEAQDIADTLWASRT